MSVCILCGFSANEGAHAVVEKNDRVVCQVSLRHYAHLLREDLRPAMDARELGL